MLNRREKQRTVEFGNQILVDGLKKLDARLRHLSEFETLGLHPDSISGLPTPQAKAIVSGARRRLAKSHHPDVTDIGHMSLINQAADKILYSIDNGNHTD